MTRRLRPGQAGLTLIELMVAMTIVSIAMAAALAVGFSVLNGYREQRKLSVVERAARISLEMMSGAIRAASPGVTTGQITDLVACSDFGALAVVNSSDGPDELKVVYASGWVVTSLRATFDESSSELVVLDDSGLRPGDKVVVTDFERGHLVEIDAVNAHSEGASLAIATPSSSACGSGSFGGDGYGAGALVIRARMARYYIAETAIGPVLMLDPDDNGPEPAEPLAEGIEDLQIAYAVDVDGDGELREDGSTTDEWFYNTAGDADPPPLATAMPAALRITLVARTTFELTDAPASARPAAEDREAADDADPYRRRSLAATVEIRNLRGAR